MRNRTDLVCYLNNEILDIDIKKEYPMLNENNYEPLKVLYILNKCGFIIPLHPYECNHDLQTIDGFIELAKSDKKIEIFNDGVIAIPGDIAYNNEKIYIVSKEEKVENVIRIPDHYLYTNVKINSKSKSYHSHYLTGEDIDMLKDSKYESIKKKNICDNHEDGA